MSRQPLDMPVRAAVLRDGAVTIDDVSLRAPLADEVRVRLVGSGICHTDLAAIEGDVAFPSPCVLGHEGSGVVDAVGSQVNDLAVGDRVVLSFAFCGRCRSCITGHPVYCARTGTLNMSGRRADGSTHFSDAKGDICGGFIGQSSFATHCVVYRSAVVHAPPDAPLELLGPLGCGIQTGAGTIINSMPPRHGSSLVVCGAGAVGLSAIMAARVVGCSTIIAVDVVPERLALADELGDDHDLAGSLRAATRGAGVDYVLDTSGYRPTVSTLLAALAPMGKMSLVGVASSAEPFTYDPRFLLRGRSIEGNEEGDVIPSFFIPYLLDLWRQGRFPFDRIVAEVGRLADLPAVLSTGAGRVIKPVITFS
jgi:aryl-alcohol dehydrogenase